MSKVQPTSSRAGETRSSRTRAHEFVVFRSHQHSYALPIIRVLAQERQEAILTTTNLPPIFAGFLRHAEGQLYPVVHLAALDLNAKEAGRKSKTSRRPCVVLAELPLKDADCSADGRAGGQALAQPGRTKTVGLLFDQLVGKYQLAEQLTSPLTSRQPLACVDCVLTIGDRSFPLINPTLLLAEIEEHCQNHLYAPPGF